MTSAGQPPGERRLARPPSDRYRAPGPGAGSGEVREGHSVRRAVGLGTAVALALAAVLTVAGGILLITAGLLAVAGIGGWLVGAAVRAGAGGLLPAARRVALSVVLALAGVALGQLGLWLYGQLEGGALGPLEYLAEVFGFLVPLELAIAGAAAWVAVR